MKYRSVLFVPGHEEKKIDERLYTVGENNIAKIHFQ